MMYVSRNSAVLPAKKTALPNNTGAYVCEYILFRLNGMRPENSSHFSTLTPSKAKQDVLEALKTPVRTKEDRRVHF